MRSRFVLCNGFLSAMLAISILLDFCTRSLYRPSYIDTVMRRLWVRPVEIRSALQHESPASCCMKLYRLIVFQRSRFPTGMVTRPPTCCCCWYAWSSPVLVIRPNVATSKCLSVNGRLQITLNGDPWRPKACHRLSVPVRVGTYRSQNDRQRHNSSATTNN